MESHHAYSKIVLIARREGEPEINHVIDESIDDDRPNATWNVGLLEKAVGVGLDSA
jgi:hypothetical protein